MEFELIVHTDWESVNSVRSELLFAIAEAFRDSSIAFAPKPAA